MSNGPMKAWEVLLHYGIENCRECGCAIGECWEFVDYSNKNIVECPQCKERYYIEDLEERLNEKLKRRNDDTQ